MTIRVAFRYNDSRIFPRLVTWYRGGDSAHCEIGIYWKGSEHDCVSSSFLDDGVRRKLIDMPADKWRIYEVDIPKHVAIEWWHDNDGKKYDVLGLLGFVWRRVKHSAKRLFCSEVAAEILGFKDAYLFDLITLESVVARIGRRVQ